MKFMKKRYNSECVNAFGIKIGEFICFVRFSFLGFCFNLVLYTVEMWIRKRKKKTTLIATIIEYHSRA